MCDAINGYATRKQCIQIYNFNRQMIRGRGYLRSIREGGSHCRNSYEKSKDDIEGKFAEFACYNMFRDYGFQCSYPTLQVWSKGGFDSGYDLLLNHNITVEVKSSSLRAKSLMLEAHRWLIDSNHHVINQDHPNNSIPDLFIMVNVGHSREYCPYPIIKICGIMSGGMLKRCVLNHFSLFKRGENIPTSRYQNRLDADNYIFPYNNAQIYTTHPVHFLSNPEKCMSFLTKNNIVAIH